MKIGEYTVTICEIILFILVVVLTIVLVVLSMLIKKNVPSHVTRKGYFYQVDYEELSLEKAVVRCECLHYVYPDGKSPKIVFKDYSNAAKNYNKMQKEKVLGTNGTAPPEVAKKNSTEAPAAAATENSRKRRDVFRDTFYYVVAVLKQQYFDDNELRFACNGLMMTEKVILASKACIESPDNWGRLLYVRSQSDYWGQGGSLHTVTRIAMAKNQAFLMVKPDIDDYDYANVLQDIPDTWDQVRGLGWDENLYKKDLGERRKLQPLGIYGWSKTNCQNNENKTVGLYMGSSGWPLVNACSEFIGFLDHVGAPCGNTKEKCATVYNDLCKYVEGVC